MSLVEILVAMAIMSIVTLSLVTMQVNQGRENRALAEKLSAMDLQRMMTLTLGKNAACTSLVNPSNLVDASVLPFDSTAIDADRPLTISLRALPSGVGTDIARAGESASPLATTPRLNNLDADLPGLQIVIMSTNGTVGAGEVRVNFNDSELVRPIANLKLPILFMLGGTPTARTIEGCITDSGGGGGGGAGSGGIVARFGSGKRCKGDNVGIGCGSNPGFPWNYNYCVDTVTGAPAYGWQLRWEDQLGGYAAVSNHCASQSVCSFAGIYPYKMMVVCIDGFEN